MRDFTKSRIIILLLLTTFFASCKTNPDKQAEDKVKKFFIEYESIGVAKAVDNLYSDNKLKSNIDSALTNIKTQLSTIENQVGRYNGYDFITKKKAGDCFLQLSYIVKYENIPVRFSFQFYRPKKEWIIFNFKFDTDISDEVEKAANLYFLNLDK